jgi:ABC-type transporter lipoprotein component MlaA
LIEYEPSFIGGDLLVKREQNIENFDALRADSIDLYAKVRSAYRQHRRQQLGLPPDDADNIAVPDDGK